jgi:GNAT superfamily N-acetyltransferase
MTSPARLQAARPVDVPVLLGLIKKLAEYERLLDQVVATEAMIHDALFGERSAAEAVIAWIGDEPVGFAIYFHNFSTFRGRQGLYLEDLFVEPAYRGQGIGKRLLLHLAHVAVARGCDRFEWAVLDWNESSIKFYQSLGATAQDDWTIYRLTGDALVRLASQSAAF